MLGFEYLENLDKMLDNGGGRGGVEHCGYLREMPNLVDEEESPPELLFDDLKTVTGGEDDDDVDRCSSSSNSSSIGNNSDEEQHHNTDDKEEEEEVQSSSCKYNNNNNGDGCGGGGGGGGSGGGGANFDDAIQALEDALPISRRGISRFYDGKSKSFTSLTDAASAPAWGPIKEIAKPENAYTKRRRNLLAHKLTCGDKKKKKKNKIYPSFHQLQQLGHTRGSRGGGISKRTTNSCKTTTTTTLALAVAMSTTTIFNDRSSPCSSPRQTTSLCNGGGGGPLLSASSSYLLSPRDRRNFSALRSFSFADLQHFTTSLTAPPPR